jgi:hypothetical protein
MWLNNSPHIDHWTNASVGINSLNFLKDGKPAFLLHPPSQNGWLIEITAVQLVWRTVTRIPLRTYLGPFIVTVVLTILWLWDSLQMPRRLGLSMALLTEVSV